MIGRCAGEVRDPAVQVFAAALDALGVLDAFGVLVEFGVAFQVLLDGEAALDSGGAHGNRSATSAIASWTRDRGRAAAGS
jgi:hypothetical protein